MMALFVSLIWLFSKSFVFYSTSSLFVAHLFWKIKFEKSHTLYYMYRKTNLKRILLSVLDTTTLTYIAMIFSIQNSNQRVKCQMSIPICDGHQLFSLFSFVLQLQHFPFSLHTFVKYSFHESHVWLCQIVFVLLVFTKKLYFGLCRFWQEIERLPCHAKVLSLLLKL